jgi:Ca2+-binding RTX toxin-like protein
VVLPIVVVLLLPGTARAGDLRIDGPTLVYTAAAGEQNRLTIGQFGASRDVFVLSDPNPATTVAPPCTRQDAVITCPAESLTAARFDLGDGDDQLLAEGESFTSKVLPLSVSGGEGNDVLRGSPLADVIDAGNGDDQVLGYQGDDRLAGGPGNDKIEGVEGRDAIDGGPGDDHITGGSDGDQILAGTGRDEVHGMHGDDVVDMRNGEVDDGEPITCDEGTSDRLLLDPGDRVLEWLQSNGNWWLERSCEQLRGQTAAPRPTRIAVRARPTPRAAVDVVNALVATIRVEVRRGGRVIARGFGTRRALRTFIKLPRSKRLRGPVSVTVTVRDTAGRTSRRTVKQKL